jgi:hypothetical protein
MADTTSRPDPPYLTSIPDPDMRRAIRTVYHDLHATIEMQQVEIQALLEVILEKHVTSIGEYKRHLARVQQGGTARTERISSQIGAHLQSDRRPRRAPQGMTAARTLVNH